MKSEKSPKLPKPHSPKKPWYFAISAVGFILKPIADWGIMQFFDEDAATKFLEKSVTISSLIPWIAPIAIFVICLIIYAYQLKNMNSTYSSDISAGVVANNEKAGKLLVQIEKMIEENSEIEDIQVFNYSIKGGKDRSIKLNYLVGMADEGVDINTILQTYFHFSFSMYKKIQKVSALYRCYLCEKNLSNKEAARIAFLESGQPLCDSLLSELNSISSSDKIGEYDCEKYRVLARLMPAISQAPVGSILANKQVEAALIKRKKTGILGAILFDGVYVFRNQNSIVKKDRIYFSFQHTKMKNTVICASINGNGETLGEDDNIEEYCENFVQRFCD